MEHPRTVSPAISSPNCIKIKMSPANGLPARPLVFGSNRYAVKPRKDLIL